MTTETATRPAETPPVPVEPTTPIRPSEALRLGRLIRPRQTFGPTFDGTDGACAVGAMEAGGLDWSYWPRVAVGCPERRPRTRLARFVARFRRPEPDVCDWPSDAIGVTIHLNDDHYWPTERIATWLESLGL